MAARDLREQTAPTASHESTSAWNEAAQYHISLLSRIRTQCWLRLATKCVFQTANLTEPVSTEMLFAPSIAFIRACPGRELTHLERAPPLVGCQRPGERSMLMDVGHTVACVTVASGSVISGRMEHDRLLTDNPVHRSLFRTGPEQLFCPPKNIFFFTTLLRY